MTPLLRPYIPADFDSLYRLDQACFARGIAYSRTTLRWYLSLPGSICLVAERDDSIVGFILASAQSSEAHLITLDVLAHYRRRGLGSLLLTTLEQRCAAAGVRATELETATNNEPAIAFWQKHGYRTVRVLPRYYLGRIDALFMRKSLTAGPEI